MDKTSSMGLVCGCTADSAVESSGREMLGLFTGVAGLGVFWSFTGGVTGEEILLIFTLDFSWVSGSGLDVSFQAL